MGQRLNLEIRDNDKVLANAYYHWYGYTGSSLDLLKIVVEKYRNADAIGGVKLAVELLSATGAGFNDEEVERVKKIPEFAGIELQPAVNRNEGLLAITQEGIEETQRYAEETVIFDIGTEEIDFGLYFGYDKDDYIERFSEEEYNDLPEADSGLLRPDLKYYEIEKLAELVKNYPNGFRELDGDVIEWIA